MMRYRIRYFVFWGTAASLFFFLASFAYADNVIHLPHKKSELDGWQGIKVRRGGDCGTKCCSLIFPKDFGYGDKTQLDILKRLVSNSIYFEHDVDCWMPIAYFTLNHILYLAIERQDANAAFLLIDRLHHKELNLDGELEEEYSGDYELPILEKFKDIKSIITEKNQKKLSDSICAWGVPRYEMSRINKLIDHLSSQSMKRFSNLLKQKCAAIEREMN